MKGRWVLLFFLSCPSLLLAGPIEEAYKASYQAEALGNLESAIKAVMPLYQKYPDGYTLNYRLAWLFYNQGALANADFHFKKTLVISPTAIENRLLYASMLNTQKRWAELEQLALEMVKTDYYQYGANLYLVTSLQVQGKFELAKKVSLKMLALYPTNTQFLQELGEAQNSLGEADAALRVFSDLLVLQPDNLEAQSAIKALAPSAQLH